LKQSKSISTSVLVILNSFLILSTVIVFAVLLFLSYENMTNTLVNETINRANNACEQVAIDVAASAVNEDVTEMDMISYIINSRMFSQTGNIYLITKDGVIQYQCINFQEYMLPTTLYNNSFRIDDEATMEFVKTATYSYSHQTKLFSHSDVIDVRTVMPVANTDLYCLIVSQNTTDSARAEYISIIFIPTMIALVVAIILFVAFVGISMRPVKEMSKVIAKVADGDYSARVEKKYTDATEMSVLTVSSDMAEMATTLNNMLEILENQEKDRNIFISSIAHDIRTPLTSINGFVTAMLDGTIPYANQEKYLSMIKNEADRIRRLVTSMTEASSLSHVDPELMEEFDLGDVLDDVIDNLVPQTSKKSITMQKVLNTDGDNSVYGEAQQLCRVIVNIISNAIKFTPYNGTIRVTADRLVDQNKMRVSVEDSGAGVEEDKRARIFESFYKADPSRKQEGFGLGLYICKQILVGHDQSIRVDESESLGGAKFVFTLPLPPSKD